jgi:hypothetical protein
MHSLPDPDTHDQVQYDGDHGRQGERGIKDRADEFRNILVCPGQKVDADPEYKGDTDHEDRAVAFPAGKTQAFLISVNTRVLLLFFKPFRCLFVDHGTPC